MAVLTILSMVGLLAVAVLLASLKGFSQARRHKKVPGVFVKVEPDERRRPESKRDSLIDFPQGMVRHRRDPAPRPVCSRTVALVEMAILLGSRSGYSNTPAGSTEPRDAMLRARRTQLPGVQPLSKS
jgi:hypothetical protein